MAKKIILMLVNICLIVVIASSCKDTTTLHNDPLGFSLRIEPDFEVSFEKGAYIQIYHPQKKSRGIIYPFLSKQAISSLECLDKIPTYFVDVLTQAKFIMSRNTNLSPDESIGELRAQQGNALALCSIANLSGVLFLAISPDGINSPAMNALLKSFTSFKFVDENQQSLPTKLWQDPQEKAFSIRVPEDYRVEGGLFRYAAIDTRVHIRATSGDGRIKLGIGDKDLPPYATPMPGFPEGSTYTPLSVAMTVKNFTSGGAFAQEYATQHAEALGCPGAQAIGVELTDFSKKLQTSADQNRGIAPRTIISAGEARVTCTNKNIETVGYIFSSISLTSTTSDSTSGTWNASVAGYTTPKSEEATARATLAFIYRNYRVDPTWMQAQQQTTMAVSQIVSKTANEIASIFSGSYAKNQIVMDNVFRSWSNATLGQTDVIDTTTGDTYKISSGNNYYWRRVGTNSIVGTDTYERPNIDFRALLEY